MKLRVTIREQVEGNTGKLFSRVTKKKKKKEKTHHSYTFSFERTSTRFKVCTIPFSLNKKNIVPTNQVHENTLLG